MIKKFIIMLVILSIIISLVGCTGGLVTPPQDNEGSIQMEEDFNVSSNEGGSFKLSDGAELEILPNSLSGDTGIKFSKIIYDPNKDRGTEDHTVFYKLEITGNQVFFLSPIKLILPISSGVPEENAFIIRVFDDGCFGIIQGEIISKKSSGNFISAEINELGLFTTSTFSLSIVIKMAQVAAECYNSYKLAKGYYEDNDRQSLKLLLEDAQLEEKRAENYLSQVGLTKEDGKKILLECAESLQTKLFDKGNVVALIIAAVKDTFNVIKYLFEINKAGIAVLDYMEKKFKLSTADYFYKQMALEVETSLAHSTGEAPLEVELDGHVSNGTKPYTYYWEFGNGKESKEYTNNYVLPIRYTYQEPGNYYPILHVKDRYGLEGEARADKVTVQESKHQPVITSSPVTSATKYQPYSYNVEATDSDGDTLTYSLTTEPSGMTINSWSGLINWTPSAVGNYNVTVKASDGELSDTQSYKITVVDDNHHPVITSNPVTSATKGESYSYNVDATDSDGDTLTYSLTTKPSGMTINSSSGMIYWTPPATGYYNVTVRVSDGELSDTQSYTITVVDDNHHPVITSNPVTSATKGESYSYNVDATDSDGDTLTYSLTTKPSGMTINSSSGMIYWTPPATGYYNVTVRVSDGELSDTQSYTITVVDDNHHPVITSNPVTSATKGESYSYNVDATDSDGDTLTYSLTTKPSGMTINSSSGMIYWTPPATGYYNVTVRVSDGELSDTQSYTITVVDDNHHPVITSNPVTSATKGESYSYNVDATDSDGDTLTYSLTTKPSGMTINSSSGMIYWTPPATGYYNVTVRVSDGELSDTQSYTITVSDDNHAPVIISDPVTVAPPGEQYIYDVDAIDPDGDTLTYSLTTKPSGMTINSSSGMIYWTPPATGYYNVTVRVSDGELSDTQSYTITVSDDNHHPVITSSPVTSATKDEPYSYNVNATDSDGDTLTYSLTTKPSGMTINSSTGMINWTPTATGYYNVTVRVYDGELSDTQSYTITVSEPPPPSGNKIFLQSGGNLNGTSINPSDPVLTVNTGESITGSLKVQAIYSGPSNNVVPFGYTPSWGSHSGSYVTVDGWIPVGATTYTVPINLTAPNDAGTYYLTFASNCEMNLGWTMSQTNWTTGSYSWNDGKDIADLTESKLQDSISTGFLSLDMLTGSTYSKSTYGIAYVKITVSEPPPPSGNKIFLQSGGNLNGTSINPSDPVLTVNTGESITGSLKVQAIYSGPSNNVVPFGYTPSWGSHSGSYVTVDGWIPVGATTYTVPINLTAPNDAGTYYLTFASNCEMNLGWTMSQTNWTTGSYSWNDGKDIADLTESKLQDSISTGFLSLDMLTGSTYSKSTYGIAYVKIEVTEVTIYNKIFLQSGGNLNGTSINPSDPVLTVNTGASITGILNVQATYTGTPGNVVPFGYTPSWGSHSSSYVTVSSDLPVGTSTYNVSINLNAPTTPGTYYLTFASNAEMNLGWTMSQTNWTTGSYSWNDGKDIADLTESKLQSSLSSGYLSLDMLVGSTYKTSNYGIAYVKITVISLL